MEQILNFIQMTAAYSNAVLVAILPHFTHVAKTLELPIPTPIVQSQIRHYFCDPRAGEVGGWVALTNGYEFWFTKGHVDRFTSPLNYFEMQDPNQIPKLYGPLRMNRKEAVELARQSLKKLGYTNDVLYTVEPDVELATPEERFAVNQGVPQYKITWHDPDLPKGYFDRLAEVYVNANVKHVDGFSLINKKFWKPNPDVGVVPQLRPKKLKPEAHFIGGHRLMPVSAEYSNACMNALYPLFTDFAVKLKLPVHLPINSEQCQNIECWTDKGEPDVQIILTNNARLNYTHGYVMDYYGGDNFFDGLLGHALVDKDDLYQPEPVSTNKMIQLARDAIHRLGYDQELPDVQQPPDLISIVPPKIVDGKTNYFSRYEICWGDKHIPGVFGFEVDLELDAKTKEVKAISLDDTNLWRSAPPMPAQ